MVRKALITRPLDDAQETAEEIQNLGHQAFCEAFLEVIIYQQDIPDLAQYAGVVFTSKNGVRAFCQNAQSRDIDVYAVGDETAAFAKQNGFKNVQSADGHIHDLMALLAQTPSEKPYLYIRGRDVSREIKPADWPVRIAEIILYHTDKKQEISLETQDLLAGDTLSDVLFFSKRTAESFVAYVETHEKADDILMGLKRTKALCLGDSMVELLSVLPWKEVLVAERPRRDSLLSLLRD